MFSFFKDFFFFFLVCAGSPVCGSSPAAASRGHSLPWYVGLSPRWPLLPRSTGSRRTGFSSCGARTSTAVAHGPQSTGSVAVAHGLSCSAACGIFPDKGPNLRPLRWQADSQPLCHQGSRTWTMYNHLCRHNISDH